MLSTLGIKNLAIVEALKVELQPGLNIITGETGAGKSIILKAIGLLAGNRAGADLIRRGADRCEVEGLFLLSKTAQQALIENNPQLEDLIEDGEVLIRRTLDAAGRSKFALNGRLITRGEVEQLAPSLFDITGQHEQRTLLDPAEHRRLLDQFGVSEESCAAVERAYSEYVTLRSRLEDLTANAAQREDYFRRIAFEAEELKRAALRAGERSEVEAELERLAHIETLTTTLGDALLVIDGAGDEGRGASAQLHQVRALVESCLRYDRVLEETVGFVEAASVQLAESKQALERYLSSLQLDPERLEGLRARVAEIAHLERKYQRKVPELIEYGAKIAAEIAANESGAFDEANLKEDLQRCAAELRTAEEKLTRERKAAAGRLADLVQQELVQLGMKNARFAVEILPAASSAHGADAIQFLLSANPGEAPRSLAKVASGGELSRVLLVLKTILNEQGGPVLQIFDEVDTGIGGAVAQIVGERLKKLARSAQVLLVTHAPQIAALAESHLVVAKAVEGERTFVAVRGVSGEERVREIARMLAGKKISENFEGSARELLNASSETKVRGGRRGSSVATPK